MCLNHREWPTRALKENHTQEAENKDGSWAHATMPTQEVIIPCPDDQQHVPLYKGWYGNIENQAKFAEDGYPSSNKGGSRLMMMEQRRGGRLRDSSKGTPIANNNSVKNLTEDVADKSTTTGPRDELIAGLKCPNTQLRLDLI